MTIRTDNSAVIARLTRERDEAIAEISRIGAKLGRCRAEVERLAKCCTQRGARMQIMRDWLDSNRGIGPPSEWWFFCEERPGAKDWFDEDGVPK